MAENFIENLDEEVGRVVGLHNQLIHFKRLLTLELERIGSTPEYDELWKLVHHRERFPLVSESEYDKAENAIISLEIMAGDCDGDMNSTGFYAYQDMYEDNIRESF